MITSGPAFVQGASFWKVRFIFRPKTKREIRAERIARKARRRAIAIRNHRLLIQAKTLRWFFRRGHDLTRSTTPKGSQIHVLHGEISGLPLILFVDDGNPPAPGYVRSLVTGRWRPFDPEVDRRRIAWEIANRDTTPGDWQAWPFEPTNYCFSRRPIPGTLSLRDGTPIDLWGYCCLPRDHEGPHDPNHVPDEAVNCPSPMDECLER